MHMTFEQAEAFDAIVRWGTYQKAADQLNKGHSALIYAIKTLEQQVNLQLFDRKGHRNQLTAEGEIVLQYCREILRIRNDLKIKCEHLRHKWEPQLQLIYDGVIDFNWITEALKKLQRSETPTKIQVSAAYLHEVEQRFQDEGADLMLTILPIKEPGFVPLLLKPLRMRLVTHKNSSLVQNKTLRLEQLQTSTYVRIRNTAELLQLETESIEFSSSFYVHDFWTKKMVILSGLGFGWLPEHLITQELKKKILLPLQTEFPNEHLLKPRLYHRRQNQLGRTASQLVQFFADSHGV